jgi:hypothetical protein
MILRSLLMMDLPASDPERALGCELPLGLGVEIADVGGVRPVAGSRVNIDVPLYTSPKVRTERVRTQAEKSNAICEARSSNVDTGGRAGGAVTAIAIRGTEEASARSGKFVNGGRSRWPTRSGLIRVGGAVRWVPQRYISYKPAGGIVHFLLALGGTVGKRG